NGNTVLARSSTITVQGSAPPPPPPPPGAIGYTVVVTMDPVGTPTGITNVVQAAPKYGVVWQPGAVYTHNPDNPDAHTTVRDEGNFTSDFAGFVQGSLHCMRDDCKIRVYFRKDVSPDPTRIEIILEAGQLYYRASEGVPGGSI